MREQRGADLVFIRTARSSSSRRLPFLDVVALSAELAVVPLTVELIFFRVILFDNAFS